MKNNKICVFLTTCIISLSTFAQENTPAPTGSLEPVIIPQTNNDEVLKYIMEDAGKYNLKGGYYRGDLPMGGNVFAFCSAPPPCPKPKSWCRKWWDTCPRGLQGK